MRTRIGVIGCGHLGKIHARILANHPDFELTAAVDPVAESRQGVAQAQGIATFGEIESLWPLVDAVVLAAPTSHHVQLGLDCLSHGKHLFVEKPLALNRTECDALVDGARLAGVTLQVGHVERFNPAWNDAAEALSGPKYIEATRRGPFSGRSTDIGVVLDLMIHDIDLALSLTGSQVVAVEALGVAVLGAHEDAAQARLTFADGCVANLNASRVSPTAQRTWQVWTPRGFTELDLHERNVTLIRAGEAILRRELDVDHLSPAERAHLKERFWSETCPVERRTPPPADAITAELSDFAVSIATGRPPRVTGTAGRDAVAVAEMILAQIAEHLWTDRSDGPRGPHGQLPPTILTAPGWHLDPRPAAAPRREAG